MIKKTPRAWLCLLVVTCQPGFIGAQVDSEFDVKAVARKMEDRFKACPRQEVVVQVDHKHRKKIWQKQALGPPTDLFADVKPNDSLLYPYLLTVEFSLPFTVGPERQSMQEAQEDSELKSTWFGNLLTYRYRATYLLSKDGIRVKSRERLSKNSDGTATSNWKVRPWWPDACWDQIDEK